MIRFCPNCQTERPLTEFSCTGTLDGADCGWDLTTVGLSAPGASDRFAGATPSTPPSAPSTCRQGHPVSEGDLICLDCGEDLGGPTVTLPAPPNSDPTTAATTIGSWQVIREVAGSGNGRQRFLVERDGRQGLLSLYAEGTEPDPDVFAALQRIHLAHVPEILELGRWSGRAFVIYEALSGGTLADFAIAPNDLSALREVVAEIAQALQSFNEIGLRHRNLRPGNIRVRSRSPLDLVITGFSSAHLSELDLDVVSPLETSRYMAPEALMGGVTAASDWWSLGMIVLEIATRKACFEGISEPLFLIHVLSNGVPIPEGLDPALTTLLKGLLTRDRSRRWQLREVQAWLAGETVAVVPETDVPAAESNGPAIMLGGQSYYDPRRFALAASQAANWAEALSLLERGALATWAESAGLELRPLSGLRQLAHRVDVPEDFRLAFALKLLNPALPLIRREEILNPGWLLDHPEEGYELIAGPTYDLLKQLAFDSEDWLLRLARRAELVRERARTLDIDLDDATLRILLLSTSRARLAALWSERQRLLPDSDHAGLAAILDRKQLSDEDLVILAAAQPGQFRSQTEILGAATELATDLVLPGGTAFDPEAAATHLQTLSRREILAELTRRTEGFARSGHADLDAWLDQFRLERTIPLERALILLAAPTDCWQKPAHQEYVSALLSFFEKKVAGSIMRGPLVRMTIGKTTARLDMAELAATPAEAGALLEKLLNRNDRVHRIDPQAFSGSPNAEARLRSLVARALTHKRDTGIDGLYLGFPFLMRRDRRGSNTRPRLAPVLLWPVKIVAEVGNRGHVTVAYDRDRGEPRLNPAFEGMLGIEATDRWREAAADLLGRSAVRLSHVMDALGVLAAPRGRELALLPGKDADVPFLENALLPSGVLFHVDFIGQAIAEDLRQLKATPPAGTALESLLRLEATSPGPSSSEPPESDRYLVAPSDPSQEYAIARAWEPPGLVVQGPPGTGKSQTIVNLVADAIGRQKSILVVCQKLPALEVVRKRLVAEGLGDRLMMVTDVNRDRQPIIRALRAQLEHLQQVHPAEQDRIAQNRKALAQRIATLEAEIDRHHEAIHRLDPVTGLSYRAILGELLDLEGGATPCPDVPALRRMLAAMPPAALSALAEACGALTPLWLAARYEQSPLACLSDFPGDEGTLRDFIQRFAAFAAATQARRDLLPPSPLPREVDDPEPFTRWLDAHETRLLALDDETRARLARWLPLFRLDKKAKAYLPILNGLIDLQTAPRPPLEVSGLRSVLHPLDPRRALAVTETCAALSEVWLQSSPEYNPLAVLLPFEPDTPAAEALNSALSTFITREAERMDGLSRSPAGLETQNPAAVTTWLASHERPLLDLPTRTRDLLVDWLPLFRSGLQDAAQVDAGTRGERMVDRLKELQAKLAELEDAPDADPLRPFFAELAPADLQTWLDLAEKATATPASWLDRLSPARFSARRKLAAKLKALGEPATETRMLDLLQQARLEEHLKGVRRTWKPIAAALGRTAKTEPFLPVQALQQQIQGALRDLSNVQTLASWLDSCPFPEAILEALHAKTSDALEDAFARMRGAALRAEGRTRSLEALEDLRHWLAPGWLETCANQVRTDQSTEEAAQPLTAAMPTLVPYQRYRSGIQSADPVVAEVFRVLSTARDRVATLPRADLPTEIGRMLRRDILLNHKAKLEASEPLLAQLHATTPEELTATRSALQAVQSVVDALDLCPLPAEATRAAEAASREAMQAFFAEIHASLAYQAARKRCLQALDALEGWCAPEWLETCRQEVVRNVDSAPRVAPILAAHSSLAAYQLFRNRARHLDPLHLEVFANLASQRTFLEALPSESLGSQVQRIVRREALLGWKNRMEMEEPLLLADRDELAFKVRSLSKADSEFRERNREHLAASIDTSRLASTQRWEDITRLQGARARRLREVFSMGTDLGLLALRPVWLMNPEVASQLLPLSRGLFDMVIFDEASQMPVEYALPTLYRAKIAVVSGDEKQMPPSAFFSSKVESDENETFDGELPDENASEQERDHFEETWNRREIKDCPDLLHLANAALPTVTLQIHYRSAYRELIGYSNSAFYRNELSVPVRHPEAEIRRIRPIELIRVDGEFSQQSNHAEAERVVDLLADLWRRPPHERPSVGVVTFNLKQADLIETVLEERAEADPAFQQAYTEELERQEDGEDMGVFVKNVENVQGDERDVIIFSTTFGRNTHGAFRRNFGALGQKGGERRLNVAVTRARRKVTLVTSIPIDLVSDFLTARRPLEGPRDYLQAYLEYARLMSLGELDAAETLRNRMTATSQARRSEAKAGDGFARSVEAFLRTLGHEPVPVGQDPALGLDFALLDPRTGLFGFGIECEAPQHRLLTKARARELWRPTVLERAYPVVHRIQARAWYHDSEAERARLAQAIQKTLGTPARSGRD